MRLVVHPDAQQELIEAADWYDERAEGLGQDLLASVDAAIAAILDSPTAWPTWPGTDDIVPPIQRYRLARFHYYSLAFQHFADSVLVLAFVHDRRRPFYWVKRT